METSETRIYLGHLLVRQELACRVLQGHETSDPRAFCFERL